MTCGFCAFLLGALTVLLLFYAANRLEQAWIRIQAEAEQRKQK